MKAQGKARRLAVTAAFCASTLFGCQTVREKGRGKEAAGTAIGAASGAAIGAAASRGSNRGRNAVIGAIAGGVAGNRIGAYMDRQANDLEQKLEGTGVKVEREGDSIRLNMPSDITFATGQAAVESQFEPVLNAVADVLKKYGETGVRIAGHTDNTGSAAVNQQLSEERARAVADILERDGIDGARIESAGYGEAQPVASNTSAAGRSKNRRVELHLYPLQS